MTDDSSTDSESAMIELIDFPGNEERAHASGERAAQQVLKILGAVHAGLGLSLAAWLQRVFEHAGDGPLSPLTWYLTIALILVMLGLITLAATPVLDQFQALFNATHVARQKARIVVYKQRKQLADSNDVAGDISTIARSKHLRSEDRRLQSEADAAGRTADRINGVSRWLAVASCALLVFSFGSVACGVIATIRHMEKPPAITGAANLKPQASQPDKKP